MMYFFLKDETDKEGMPEIEHGFFTSLDAESFMCPFCSKKVFEVYTDHNMTTTFLCVSCKHSIHLCTT